MNNCKNTLFHYQRMTVKSNDNFRRIVKIALKLA